MPSYAAIVLAGGAARRMGGAPKPLLPVHGVPLLTRVLAAVADAEPVIVVGPPSLRAELPPRVLLTREDPPGGGPVAAVAAGLAGLAGLAQSPAGTEPAGNTIAVLAADLPFLTAPALELLRERLRETGADVALFLDENGRRQQLCALWRAEALAAAVPIPADGVAMRDLLAAADVAEVAWAGAGPAPWYDCDTPAELAHAEEMS